jgi:iron complex transport system ATP-binding protein
MIETHSLRCGYGSRNVLDGVDLRLQDSEFSVLAGPNGSGKSTLLYTLLGYLRPSSGTISMWGKSLASYKRMELARLIAFVPQECVFQFDYRVREIVLMGRFPYLGVMQTYGPEDHKVADSVLCRLGLEDFRERWFSQLSGGEKQRVLIARALAQDTKFIFLDESLSQLDINHQIEIMGLLRSIHTQSGIGVLLISHNLNLAANYAGRLIFLKDGKVLGSGTPFDLMRPEVLSALFGMRLSTAPHPVSGIPNLIYPGADA